jgi:hypothetical protein
MHPAAAVTGAAKTRPGQTVFARTGTGRAVLAARVVNRLAAAGSGLFQADFKAEANIGRPRRRFRFLRRGIDLFALRIIAGQQALVGGANLLETLSRVRMIAAIGMPAHGLPSIGAFQLGRRRARRNAENVMRIGIH